MRRTMGFGALVLALAAGTARADDKVVLAHSGRLFDGSDQPVTGPQQLSFRILDQSAEVASEKEIWSSGACAVSVDKGFYAVALGAGECGKDLTAPMLPLAEQRYLEISVGGVKLSPRLRLSSVPTAVLAGDALALGGLPPASYAQKGDLQQAVSDLTQQLAAKFAAAGGTISGNTTVQGTLAADRLTGDGSGLTKLSAAQLTGTVPDAAIPAGVALLSDGQTFLGTKGFTNLTASGNVTANGTITGKHAGDGSALTNLDGSKLTGALQVGVFTAEPFACSSSTVGRLGYSAGEQALKVCTASGWQAAGGAKGLRLSASTFDFGASAQVAQTVTLTVTNDGQSAVQIAGVTTSPGFLVRDNGCTSLGAGASCNVTLQLSAQTAGARTGTVTVLSSAGSYSAALSGTLVAPASCQVIKQNQPTASDGLYVLEPRPGVYPPFQAWCDMTTDGGGWTLLMSTNDQLKWAGSANVWYDGSFDTFPVTPQMGGKSLAWLSVTGTQLLFKTHLELAGRWASFTFGTTPQTMGQFLGTTPLLSLSSGCGKQLTARAAGSAAVSCWSQTWCANFRSYSSSDTSPDSSVFAPLAAGVSAARPCGGSTAYATGIGLVTDSNPSGYGGTFEGGAREGGGFAGMAGGYVSIAIR